MSKTVWAMYFSGTGTTEKMTKHIAEGLAEKIGAEFRSFDFTVPAARKEPAVYTEDDIVVLGTPVIAGRVPNLLLKYLDTLKGGGALGIPVVMYGCRAFDDALTELRNIMENDGFHTFAGAACAAEHSMSTNLGAGRPDVEDMKEADSFIEKAASKYAETEKEGAFPEDFTPVQVDGNDPPGPYYIPRDAEGGPIDIRKVKPETDDDKCDKCGKCAELCPLGSISFEDYKTVEGICMKCCACIKKCPKNAKYFDDEMQIYHITDLENRFGKRRAENAWFI